MRNLTKKVLDLAKKNYLLSFFSIATLFVVLAVGYKLFFSKPTYVYAKVKVGQGLWWANTQKPTAWFVDAILAAKEEKDLSDKPVAKIDSVSYYPYYGGGQYDVYVTLRLLVSKIGKERKYSFQRSTIGVSSPIDLEFKNVQFSGTIIELSDKPITDSYVEKTVTLTKRNALPWEYDSIVLGDHFFNGETDTIRILDKQSTNTTVIANDSYGNYIPSYGEDQKYVTVKVKLKGKMVNGQFFYGEEQMVVPGRNIGFATNDFVFSDYLVARVE